MIQQTVYDFCVSFMKHDANWDNKNNYYILIYKKLLEIGNDGVRINPFWGLRDTDSAMVSFSDPLLFEKLQNFILEDKLC